MAAACLSLIALMMNARSRLTGIATGDQAMFVTRAAFERAGGFPAIALMEDVALSAQLKRMGRPLALRARVTTSPRRWRQHGTLRTMLLMWRLRLSLISSAPIRRKLARALWLCAARSTNPVSIAIMAKAPIPGLAKTRLIPSIGAHAAAVLQERLTERAVATALAAAIGPVTLWCAPDIEPRLVPRSGRAPRASRSSRSREGDLGARMLAAMAASGGPALVIGTDCPALTAGALARRRKRAARWRRRGADPGRGRRLCADRRARGASGAFFRHRLGHRDGAGRDARAYHRRFGLALAELPPLWDVDTENDLARLEREHPELAL